MRTILLLVSMAMVGCALEHDPVEDRLHPTSDAAPQPDDAAVLPDDASADDAPDALVLIFADVVTPDATPPADVVSAADVVTTVDTQPPADAGSSCDAGDTVCRNTGLCGPPTLDDHNCGPCGSTCDMWSLVCLRYNSGTPGCCSPLPALFCDPGYCRAPAECHIRGGTMYCCGT